MAINNVKVLWLFSIFVPLRQKLQIIHGPRRWTVWTHTFFLSKFRPDLIYADCTYYALMHLISMEKSFFSRLLSLAFICQAKILDISMTYLKISMLMPYISLHNLNWFWRLHFCITRASPTFWFKLNFLLPKNESVLNI